MSALSQAEQPIQGTKVLPVSYKKDFLEIPYLVNSPKLMMEGFKKLPFAKHKAANQSVSSKTTFVNSVTYYRNIQDELFVVYTEMTFKDNICFKCQYDPSSPADHYCLTFRVTYHSKNINSLANGIGHSPNSWLIFKPGAKVDHYHFKGTRGKYISVYFTKAWVEKHIIHGRHESSAELATFIRSENDYLICPYLPASALFDIGNLSPLFSSSDMHEPEYPNRLKEEILKLFSFFTAKMKEERIDENHFKLSNLERIRVLRAEQLLRACVYRKFPGISYLAKEAGLSETTLKECFKTVYNKTLLQYFQALQMGMARELILADATPIHRIAGMFGYENRSKFSIAFKKYHGCLPSLMRQGLKKGG